MKISPLEIRAPLPPSGSSLLFLRFLLFLGLCLVHINDILLHGIYFIDQCLSPDSTPQEVSFNGFEVACSTLQELN